MDSSSAGPSRPRASITGASRRTGSGVNKTSQPTPIRQEPISGKFPARRCPNVKVIPEWSVSSNRLLDDENPALCAYKRQDNKVLSNPKLKFNFWQFKKYQDLKSKLFAAQRFEDIRHGVLQPRKQITDEEILEEMMSRFGDLDRESSKFKKLFDNYKESYLEQVEECKEEESNKMYAVYKTGQSLVDHSFECTSKIHETINRMFSPAEIQTFEMLNPKENEVCADWLNLPRPKGKWEQEVLRDLKKFPISEVMQQPINFSQIDPKYVDFPKWTTLDKGPAALESEICLLLNRFIHEFPCGIAPAVFWEKLYRKHHFRIDLSWNNYNCGFLTLDEIFPALPDIFYVTTVTNGKDSRQILFPASFKGQIVPMPVFCTRVRHIILQALSMSEGFIPLATILETVRAITGVKLNIFDWGFTTVKEFLEIYMQVYEDSVTIEEIRMVEEDRVILENYLVINSPHYMNSFNIVKAEWEKKDDLQDSSAVNHKSIPDRFMQPMDHIQHVSDYIVTGQMHQCFPVLSEATSPSNFRVILRQNWNFMGEFHTFVQQEYLRVKNYTFEVEVEANMKPGLAVLCKSVGDIYIGMEWFRGQILEYLPAGKAYRVWLFDYGKEVVEPFECLRYLPKELMDEECAQAIKCHLKLGPRLETYQSSGWTTEQKDIFKALLRKGIPVLKFHSSSFCVLTNQRSWEVIVSILSKDINGQEVIVVDNVAQALEEELLEDGLEEGEASLYY